MSPITPNPASEDLVLENEFEELGVAEAVATGFLQADVEALGKAGELELFEGGDQGQLHGKLLSGFRTRMVVGRHRWVTRVSHWEDSLPGDSAEQREGW